MSTLNEHEECGRDFNLPRRESAPTGIAAIPRGGRDEMDLYWTRMDDQRNPDASDCTVYSDADTGM